VQVNVIAFRCARMISDFDSVLVSKTTTIHTWTYTYVHMFK